MATWFSAQFSDVHFTSCVSLAVISKAQIPLGSSRQVSTQHVSSPCILAVSSLSNSTTRHARLVVERVVSRRDVTSQVEFGLKPVPGQIKPLAIK